ncbi:YrhC family protein [Alteribacter natronophilus]|uniref:YrhC family protein n=1 Tax=Alteribacter natronophilus TaxID=2583810 RepID=UPI001AEE7FC1|nr:YrhC family protein [Alteribacter natronophilus]
MAEKQMKALKEKVTDYKRYAFVLLSLSIFMFIGLLLPTEALATESQPLYVVMNMAVLVLAVVFHRIAMFNQKKLNEGEA